MLERSPEMVAAALGAMKCGGTWLPLDPDTPRARLEGILAEAAPRALVARQDPGGWAWLFPGMFGPVLDAMESRGFPPSIRLVTTGGETVQAPDVQRWQAFFRDRGLRPPRLVNNFGLTEATMVSLACDLTERDVSSGLVPLGRPLPGTLVRVLDPDGAEALEGELFLGGPGLARGYLGRPELTGQRFVEIRGERLYRTGDRVRRLPHGELAFLGRVDRQVKVGGYRVELETLVRQPAGARLAYLRCVLGRACRKGAGTIGRSLGRTGLPAVPLTAREDYAPRFYPGELLLLRARHQVPMLRVHRALG